MHRFSPVIESLYVNLDKFVMFSLGNNNTENQSWNIIHKGLELIKQLDMVNWEKQAGSILQAENARMDAQANVVDLTATADEFQPATKKATKSNKKAAKKVAQQPEEIVNYTDLIHQARAPAPATLSSTLLPLSATTLQQIQQNPSQSHQASPWMQQSAPHMQQAHISHQSTVPAPQPQPPIPQRSNVSQTPQPHLIVAKTTPYQMVKVAAQFPMPSVQQPSVQQMQEVNRLRQMASNAQYQRIGAQQQMKPQAPQQTRPLTPQQMMTPPSSQSPEPQNLLQKAKQEVTMWIQGRAGGRISPTPEQQRLVTEARRNIQIVNNLKVMQNRTPEQQQEGFVANQNVTKHFSALVHSIVGNQTAENPQPMGSTMQNATPTRKRSAPIDFGTPSPQRKRVVVIGIRGDGQKVIGEGLGNGVIRTSSGHDFTIQQLREQAPKLGITMLL